MPSCLDLSLAQDIANTELHIVLFIVAQDLAHDMLIVLADQW